MRIISGKFKGRTIPVPRNFKGRPTTDFARESLFNMLQNELDFEGLRVLDLFAGTGAVGLECFSRGADEVLSVELSAVHQKWIGDLYSLFGAAKAKAIKADAFRFLTTTSSQFDFVFADPPYDHPRLGELPQLVLSSTLLPPGGLFVLEHSADFDFQTHASFYKHRKYGAVNFTFFRIPEA